MTRPLLALSLIALAVACTQSPPPPVTPPPDPSAIARISVTPDALLLTQQGQKQTLSVKAFNSSGAEVTATATWTSSRPDQVSASSSGELEARVSLGSSQIVAQIGNVKSAPVLISIAQPAAGVTLISDAQVRGTPTLVDPNAETDPDNPYEVLLTGIAPTVPGSLLLGREGKAIGGEFVSSVQEGDAVRVRLKLASVTQLMARAQIKETVDFTNLPLQLPPEIVRDYEVTQVDGEYRFTPNTVSGATVRPQAIKEFKLGPYNCEFATPELPISLGQPGQFSLKFNPSLEIDFDPDAGLRKLIARAELSAKMKAAIVLSAGGLLNLDCTATLYSKLLPLPGWAGLILAGELKAGIGFEIEGATSFPLGGVELMSETKGTLEMGLDCVSGECKLVRSFNPVNTTDLRFVKPSVANIRPAELFIFGYGFAKIKAGMTLIDKLRMDVVTARAGLKLEGSFAPPSTQLEPSTSALEPDYQSSYKLGLLAEVVAGSINKTGDSAFRKLLQKLGIFKFNLFKFQTSKTLATSRKGTATQDKKDFKVGDTLTFNVKLDSLAAGFPFIGYNVERILIMRKDGSSPAEVLATLDATPDQLEFSLPWVADADSTSPRGSAFYAFVDTKLPVPFDLEIAKVSVVPAAYAGNINLNLTYTESGDSYTDVETLTMNGSAKQQLGEQMVFDTISAVAYARDFRSSNSRERNDRGCIWRQNFTNHQFWRLANPIPEDSSFGPLGASGAVLILDAFSAVNVTGLVTSGQTTTATGTRISGECTGIVDFSPVPPKTTTSSGVGNAIQRISLPRLIFPITLDPSGLSIVVTNVSGSVPVRASISSSTATMDYAVALDLKPQTSDADQVDLELDIIAPVSAAPSGKLTYAVNLHNKSQTAASSIRAEFYLPEGFTVLDTQGWSACTTVLTSVTCASSSLAVGERRAFLIDVQAPASIGEYIVSARVSSDERDPNSSDNFDTGATLILEP